MIIAIDFDDTLVEQNEDYHDLETPLEFKPGAKEAVLQLKAAGHTLVLFSARANKALRQDWGLNPLWRNGLVPFDRYRWAASLVTNIRRYQQMLTFIEAEVPGVFAYVDDGEQGKISADVYIDDKALRYGQSVGWPKIAVAYGEPEGGE